MEPKEVLNRSMNRNCNSREEQSKKWENVRTKLKDLMSTSEGEKIMKETKEMINHPEHYNREGAMECIDEMVLLFGIEEAAIFCKLNAYKYRYRAGSKDNASEDMKKSDWYMNKYKELIDYNDNSHEFVETAYNILLGIRDKELDDIYIEDAIGYLGEALD